MIACIPQCVNYHLVYHQFYIIANYRSFACGQFLYAFRETRASKGQQRYGQFACFLSTEASGSYPQPPATALSSSMQDGRHRRAIEQVRIGPAVHNGAACAGREELRELQMREPE